MSHSSSPKAPSVDVLDDASSWRGRVMRAAVDDFANVIFLRPLVEAVRARAPAARFAVEAEADDSFDRLGNDELDLIVGHLPEVPPGLQARLLAQDEMVLAVGAAHPLVRGGRSAPVTLADIARFPHVESLLETRRPRPLDALLAARGLERRIAVSTADYWSASFIAAQGDAILTVPSRVMTSLAVEGLVVLPTDLPVETIACRAVWHPRLEANPCVRFVVATLAAIGAAP